MPLLFCLQTLNISGRTRDGVIEEEEEFTFLFVFSLAKNLCKIILYSWEYFGFCAEESMCTKRIWARGIRVKDSYSFIQVTWYKDTYERWFDGIIIIYWLIYLLIYINWYIDNISIDILIYSCIDRWINFIQFQSSIVWALHYSWLGCV